MGKPKQMLDSDQCTLMAHYLKIHQQSDGGWGTHIESPSTMFGTVCCYVALRLLESDAGDADADSPYMVRGRAFIQKHGGATLTSSWAKFWLCLLGCMEWEGHNSVPPEMWLLPNWFPFHPGRMWCHCRMVYLPMGYLYGVRFVYKDAETDGVILSLRKEVCFLVFPPSIYFLIKWCWYNAPLTSMISSSLSLYCMSLHSALLSVLRHDTMGQDPPPSRRDGQLLTHTPRHGNRSELSGAIRSMGHLPTFQTVRQKVGVKVLYRLYGCRRYTDELYQYRSGE